MCAIDIPYTFVPGTKAKANEVNSNFNAFKTFVDQNEVNIAQNSLDIQNLQDTKAELNGAIEQTFQVANPTNNYDAVNKQWFLANTANSKDTISGFQLTKQSNTSVSATAGSAWDSTYEYMITSGSSLTEDQSNLGQNATYYVYVCADKETSNVELIFSLSNATPELPSGYDYYRLLGNFKTDSNGNISTVTSVSQVSFPSQLQTNGYITLPGGLTIQWGTTSGWDGQQRTVSYGQAFTTCFVFNYSDNIPDRRADRNSKMTLVSFNNTSYTIRPDIWDELPDGGWSAVRVYWIAIGVM